MLLFGLYLRARSVAVITPPCHGGDRRFKSGRARHIAYALQNTTFMVVFFI